MDDHREANSSETNNVVADPIERINQRYAKNRVQSAPLYQVLEENRRKQDLEHQAQYAARNTRHRLTESDIKWLNSVKSLEKQKQEELEQLASKRREKKGRAVKRTTAVLPGIRKSQSTQGGHTNRQKKESPPNDDRADCRIGKSN